MALTLQSWSEKYILNLDALLDNHLKQVEVEIAKVCVDDLGGKLNSLVVQKPLERRLLNRDPTVFETWRRLLTLIHS